MHAVAILGVSGYSGQEVLDRVLRHPELEVVALGSDSLAGSPAAALDVRLNGSLPAFVPNDEALAAGADVVFLCLGHERAAAIEPPAGAVVVDLSGAHRLADPVSARAWYADAPGAWSYGLPELYAPVGNLIANPGCYATAGLLAPAPPAGGARRGARAEDELPRGLRPREPLPLRGRRAPPCAGDRAAARLSRHLRATPAA